MFILQWHNRLYLVLDDIISTVKTEKNLTFNGKIKNTDLKPIFNCENCQVSSKMLTRMKVKRIPQAEQEFNNTCIFDVKLFHPINLYSKELSLSTHTTYFQ